MTKLRVFERILNVHISFSFIHICLFYDCNAGFKNFTYLLHPNVIYVLSKMQTSLYVSYNADINVNIFHTLRDYILIA